MGTMVLDHRFRGFLGTRCMVCMPYTYTTQHMSSYGPAKGLGGNNSFRILVYPKGANLGLMQRPLAHYLCTSGPTAPFMSNRCPLTFVAHIPVEGTIAIPPQYISTITRL